MTSSWELVDMYQRGTDPLELLQILGGFYECPKDANGKRLGLLVGYAGRDKQGRQKVGDVYVNCALFEEWPELLHQFAKDRRFVLPVGKIDAFCGSPMGGLAFAQMLALAQKKRYIFSEKKVTELVEGGKEKSDLVFGRHQPKEGENVVIVEDVANQFSTTDQQILLVRKYGANVVGIFCLLNRSTTVDDRYYSGANGQVGIPVISLIRKPFPSYKQDDPEVAEDVVAGNVVWKPKGTPQDWARLMAAMNAAGTTFKA
jgi:orotate phosphoribosyltransferase